MNLSRYDFIFPLGEACFTARMMTKLHLRKMSCPFDWMHGASFEERCKIFLNDFKDFINKKDLIFQETYIKGKITHNVYLNTKTGIYFNHDFPPNIDLEVSYDEVRTKYERRIERSLNMIKKSKNVLLLYIELPDSKRKLTEDGFLEDFMNSVSKKYPQTKLDFLYIRHNENLKDNEAVYKQIFPYVYIAECNNKPKNSNSPLYLCNKQNTKKILQKVRLKNHFFHTVISFIKQKILKIT